MRLTIKPSDVLRSKVIEPGWHPAEITGVEESVAKTDQSANVTIKFVITDGPFKNVPVERLFNEKAPGFAINFVETLSGKKCSDKEETNVDLSEERLKGRKLQLFIKNDLYQGVMKNRVEDFRPL